MSSLTQHNLEQRSEITSTSEEYKTYLFQVLLTWHLKNKDFDTRLQALPEASHRPH